jgi:hypothetical protein
MQTEKLWERGILYCKNNRNEYRYWMEGYLYWMMSWLSSTETITECQCYLAIQVLGKSSGLYYLSEDLTLMPPPPSRFHSPTPVWDECIRKSSHLWNLFLKCRGSSFFPLQSIPLWGELPSLYSFLKNRIHVKSVYIYHLERPRWSLIYSSARVVAERRSILSIWVNETLVTPSHCTSLYLRPFHACVVNFSSFPSSLSLSFHSFLRFSFH